MTRYDFMFVFDAKNLKVQLVRLKLLVQCAQLCRSLLALIKLIQKAQQRRLNLRAAGGIVQEGCQRLVHAVCQGADIGGIIFRVHTQRHAGNRDLTGVFHRGIVSFLTGALPACFQRAQKPIYTLLYNIFAHLKSPLHKK